MQSESEPLYVTMFNDGQTTMLTDILIMLNLKRMRLIALESEVKGGNKAPVIIQP